jgi:renalase
LKKIAIIGAGIAGITCARTLIKAGHFVHVFEKNQAFGGRMSTRGTSIGSFDHGAPYFDVSDARFKKALEISASRIAPWRGFSSKAMIALPGMSALVTHWAMPFLKQESQLHQLSMETQVTGFEAGFLNREKWQIRSTKHDIRQDVVEGFDAIILAVPSVQAAVILGNSGQSKLQTVVQKVPMQPRWTMMIGFENNKNTNWKSQGFSGLQMQDSCISWISSEMSKVGRTGAERYTIHASTDWSERHVESEHETIQNNMLSAFARLTGITTEPTFQQVHLWRYAQAAKPLGQTHIWDQSKSIGVCGDWCLGNTVEHAFVSGLELAMQVLTAK